jgi:hypothetical protein
VTDAALRALLLDCLKVWEVKGRIIAASPDGLAIETVTGAFVVRQAEEAIRPVRWFLLTPERQAAGRAPRALPSVVALLSALRNAMAGTGGTRLRIGTGGASEAAPRLTGASPDPV